MRPLNFKVGDKIKFAEEKRSYTVRACNLRFLVCTKPFNLRPNTVIYTLVDLAKQIRGTNNYIFNPWDYVSDQDCEECLHELTKRVIKRDLGEDSCEISHRTQIDLNIIS